MGLVPTANEERRQHRRHLCSELVDVSFEDDMGIAVKETGLVEDVSVDGMCLSFSLPVPLARAVSIRAEDFSGSGEVAYCEVCDYGYLIGLKFPEGAGWDASRWLPQHLLPLG